MRWRGAKLAGLYQVFEIEVETSGLKRGSLGVKSSMVPPEKLGQTTLFSSLGFNISQETSDWTEATVVRPPPVLPPEVT